MEVNESSKSKEELINEYNAMSGEDRKILDISYSVVSDTDAKGDRLEEIIEFSKRMGFKKIGVAFCKGLRKYGEQVDKELSRHFEVTSVPCNASGIIKDDIGVKPIKSGEELACNPLGQAAVFNSLGVDMVVKCGFCLGHDMLFSKNIDAHSTALFVKDRKNGHDTTKLFG